MLNIKIHRRVTESHLKIKLKICCSYTKFMLNDEMDFASSFNLDFDISMVDFNI